MATKKTKAESTEEQAAPAAAEAQEPEGFPELWPPHTNPQTRELMEAHGIMGPKAMAENWERSKGIFEAHGFKWQEPE